MKFRQNVVAVAVVMLITACGGGGGGSAGGGSASTGAVTAPSVSITSANAPTVAAASTGDVQSVSNVADSTSTIGAAQVVNAADSNKLETLTTMRANQVFTQFALKAAPHVSKTNAINAASISNETVPCDSGTMTVSGSVANSSSYSTYLTQGDYISITANNCRYGTDVLNGGLYVEVSSGSFTNSTYYSNVGLSMKFTGLNLTSSTASGTAVTGMDGDASFVMSKTVSNSTMDIRGTVLTRSQTINGTVSRTSLKNYSQRYVVSTATATATATVSAEVHTTNTTLGATGGSYKLTTTATTPLVWNTLTGDIQSGVVVAEGANGTKVRATFDRSAACADCVYIETDSTGNGYAQPGEFKTRSAFEALY
jgi:hypothetical protein